MLMRLMLKSKPKKQTNKIIQKIKVTECKSSQWNEGNIQTATNERRVGQEGRRGIDKRSIRVRGSISESMMMGVQHL